MAHLAPIIFNPALATDAPPVAPNRIPDPQPVFSSFSFQNIGNSSALLRRLGDRVVAHARSPSPITPLQTMQPGRTNDSTHVSGRSLLERIALDDSRDGGAHMTDAFLTPLSQTYVQDIHPAPFLSTKDNSASNSSEFVAATPSDSFFTGLSAVHSRTSAEPSVSDALLPVSPVVQGIASSISADSGDSDTLADSSASIPSMVVDNSRRPSPIVVDPSPDRLPISLLVNPTIVPAALEESNEVQQQTYTLDTWGRTQTLDPLTSLMCEVEMQQAEWDEVRILRDQMRQQGPELSRLESEGKRSIKVPIFAPQEVVPGLSNDAPPSISNILTTSTKVAIHRDNEEMHIGSVSSEAIKGVENQEYPAPVTSEQYHTTIVVGAAPGSILVSCLVPAIGTDDNNGSAIVMPLATESMEIDACPEGAGQAASFAAGIEECNILPDEDAERIRKQDVIDTTQLMMCQTPAEDSNQVEICVVSSAASAINREAHLRARVDAERALAEIRKFEKETAASISSLSSSPDVSNAHKDANSVLASPLETQLGNANAVDADKQRSFLAIRHALPPKQATAINQRSSPQATLNANNAFVPAKTSAGKFSSAILPMCASSSKMSTVRLHPQSTVSATQLARAVNIGSSAVPASVPLTAATAKEVHDEKPAQVENALSPIYPIPAGTVTSTTLSVMKTKRKRGPSELSGAQVDRKQTTSSQPSSSDRAAVKEEVLDMPLAKKSRTEKPRAVSVATEVKAEIMAGIKEEVVEARLTVVESVDRTSLFHADHISTNSYFASPPVTNGSGNPVETAVSSPQGLAEPLFVAADGQFDARTVLSHEPSADNIKAEPQDFRQSVSIDAPEDASIRKTMSASTPMDVDMARKSSPMSPTSLPDTSQDGGLARRRIMKVRRRNSPIAEHLSLERVEGPSGERLESIADHWSPGPEQRQSGEDHLSTGVERHRPVSSPRLQRRNTPSHPSLQSRIRRSPVSPHRLPNSRSQPSIIDRPFSLYRRYSPPPRRSSPPRRSMSTARYDRARTPPFRPESQLQVPLSETERAHFTRHGRGPSPIREGIDPGLEMSGDFRFRELTAKGSEAHARNVYPNSSGHRRVPNDDVQQRRLYAEELPPSSTIGVLASDNQPPDSLPSASRRMPLIRKDTSSPALLARLQDATHYVGSSTSSTRRRITRSPENMPRHQPDILSRLSDRRDDEVGRPSLGATNYAFTSNNNRQRQVNLCDRIDLEDRPAMPTNRGRGSARSPNVGDGRHWNVQEERRGRSDRLPRGSRTAHRKLSPVTSLGARLS